MRTTDHKTLSEYVLEKMGAGMPVHMRLAFIFGSVEPDLNVCTYPHNSVFEGSLRGHCAYEAELHSHISAMLDANKAMLGRIPEGESLAGSIESLHEDYIAACPGLMTDYCYIVYAVSMVYERCAAECREELPEAASLRDMSEPGLTAA